MAVYNPLDQDKLPSGEVSQRNKTRSALGGGRLNWLSIFVDVVFLFPVFGDIGYALSTEGNVILILHPVTAFNAVVMPCARLNVNNLKPLILVPDM